MEPRRETSKRAASPAPKQGASKKPQGEASTPNQQAGGQQTGGQNQDLLQHAKQAAAAWY